MDSYVKKTAIIGCIKMYHQNKSSFKKNNQALTEQLYELLNDPDGLVVINAIDALNEILADKGGIDITR